MIINYIGPAGTIPRCSLVDVAHGKVPAAAFKGKVVFIGLTAGSEEEAQPLPTPFGPMPRVEITANAVHSILERNYLFLGNLQATLGFLFAFGLLLGLIVPLFRPGVALAVTLTLLLLYLAVAVITLRVGHALLPFLPALLLAVVFCLANLALRAALGRDRATVTE